MIVVVEGTSASGKSTLCARHGARMSFQRTADLLKRPIESTIPWRPLHFGRRGQSQRA